jgi:creatinine amidohydrolase
MGHACEWETSMMLRIRPDLVGDYRSAEDVTQSPPAAPGHQAWITKDRSGIGHIGRPNQATADKGEALLRHFSDNVARYLEGLSARS